MINSFSKLFNRFTRTPRKIYQIGQIEQRVISENQTTRLLLGRIIANQVRTHGIYANIRDAEFKVFSQFGDDGILQYLIYQTCAAPQIFIEFGVQDYSEANTRFLLMNDNWRGLIMDSDTLAMSALQANELFWRHDLTAVPAFITRENINPLFRENGFWGEIGLLSIDVDGNDYWVWEAINSVNPILVTVEYNSIFGPEHAITIPYDPLFSRTKAHYSNLFWGCSLKALCLLAERKGYAFVGSNSNGNNAHFVRKDKVGKIPVVTCEQGYVESKFRESRDKDGNLTFISGKKRIETIRDMSIFNLETDKVEKIANIFGLE
jgi:hypothetical protein